MKNTFALLAAGLATAALPLVAADIDLSKLPPAAKQTGVTYDKDIKPILESTCFRCHGDRQQKGGLRVDSLDSILKGGKEGKVITPGDSAKSQLVISVAQIDPDTAMPPKRQGRGPRPGGPPGGGPDGNPPPGGPGGPDAGPGGPGPRGTNTPPGGGFGGPGRPGGPGGMPPKPLTPEQVGLIRAWIDQGAK